MENNKMLLEVEDFSIVQDISEEQFAIVEVYVCHDGNNRHNMPIKLSTLKKAASTLKNKYLVAGFDGVDFEGHEPDEMIVGHFPESGKISYKKKNGKTYLVAEAIMSKVYADWAYDQFVEQNHKGVSMEISVTKTKEDNDGRTEIKEFVFNGVTILGDSHTPACEGADASIIKFSVENASECYSKYSWKSNVIVRNFVDSMGVETGKEGTEVVKEETVVTEINTESLENTENVTVETNETVEKETVVEETVETTEEEVFEGDKEKVEDDDTALMEEDKDKDEKDDESKDKSDDDDADKEEDMEAKEDKEDKSDDKKFESLTAEQKYQVFQAACKDSCLGYLESYDDEYLYVYDYCEGYIYRHSYTLDGTNVTIGEDKERVMRGGYVPFEADTETTEETVTEETNAAENVTNPEVETLQEEIAELKATIADYEAEKKSLEVESILSGVIDTLSPEQISNLREEAKEFSLDRMGEFSNKVKALAFESVKGSESKYSFARVAFGQTNAEPTTTGKYSW